MEKLSSAICLENLTIGYLLSNGRRVEVSRNINASLESGQLTCLLGPNGAGKSTLLRTLAGFQPLLDGEIKVFGTPVNELSLHDKARLLGVVLTDRISLDNTTVEELIALGRSPYSGFWGRISEEDAAIVAKSLTLVGIEELGQRKVNTLSDGERQKVMIAKVLAQETPIIFLDEPTAFLDYPGKVDILRLLHRLAHEEGKTVFLSTHDLEIALKIADMAWLLDKRHGLSCGTPRALAAEGTFDLYFGLGGTEFDPTAGLAAI